MFNPSWRRQHRHARWRQAAIRLMYRLNGCGALWQDDNPNRIPLKMLKLVIGNKNYSSWSMRPWLALRANGIPFEEIFVPLYTANNAHKNHLLPSTPPRKPPPLLTHASPA